MVNKLDLSFVGLTMSLLYASEATSGVIVGAITINIFLAVLLGISMKKLWIMIGTIQIVTHFPLLLAPLPSNALLCLTALLDAANMNLIPKKYMTMATSFIVNTASQAQSKAGFSDIF